MEHFSTWREVLAIDHPTLSGEAQRFEAERHQSERNLHRDGGQAMRILQVRPASTKQTRECRLHEWVIEIVDRAERNKTDMPACAGMRLR